jgi:regulator of nonsense transcripts 3
MASSAKAPNGMLPIPASATKKPTAAPKPSKSQGRAGLPKLRLIVRRLPPGLTEDEFQAALGDEWKVGAGKVDWAAYKEGKISKE